MYLYIKALQSSQSSSGWLGYSPANRSLSMTLMLRLALRIRGNLQGEGITALQVDHAADNDRHLAGQQWVTLLLGYYVLVITMTYLANGLTVSATIVTSAKKILSYCQ